MRVYEWLDRIATPYSVSGYAGLPNSSPRSLLQHPVRVLRAEVALRRLASSHPDRLLIHREASPLSRGALEKQLLRSADFGVYDFDDALQCDFGEGHLFRRWAPKAPKALAAVREADRVIAGNPVLADWADQFNDDVIVIPSCVAPDAYREKTTFQVSDEPRLVWIGSIDNETYIHDMRSVFFEVNRLTGARLTLISDPVGQRLGDLDRIVDRIAWSETAQHERLAQFDVGVAPVPDEPYERGKCGYKLLQYAASGLPFVASPVGVNQRMLTEFGMPAPVGEREWVDAIVDLLTCPPSRRTELGRSAREQVRRLYSFDAWLSAWQDAVGLSATVASN